MNREIKFRFVDETSTIYGPLRLIDLIEQVNYCTKHPGAQFIEAKNNDWLTLKEFLRGMRFGEITIEQYVGDKDCSDSEVYEGDILKDCVGDDYWVATFESGGFMIKSVEYGDVPATVENISDCGLSTLEIVGNIHENPELLRGEV